MKTQSCMASRVPQAGSPVRHLPLVDLLVDTKAELLELALRSGLQIFTTMLEEDRTSICGPRYAHAPSRLTSQGRRGAGPRTVQKRDRGVDGRSCITRLTDRSRATSHRAAGGTGRDHGVAVPSTAAGSGEVLTPLYVKTLLQAAWMIS